ncbi:MAG: GGDEF domain-containing protein [Candidatus Gastranaerophilales bacterium]|nr:GGDEF domain-containing protein [Candidatus Gastranaerophilales bacterium]
MKNAIIFTDKNSSDYEEMLKSFDEIDVRVKNISELKDVDKYNPYLLILDLPEQKIKDVAMVTRFPVPTLIIADKIYSDITVRGEAYDYAIKPVSQAELNLRIKNLMKIKDLKETINLVSTTDELTGLHNRRFLHERLEAEISRARRYETKLSCLLLDIDFFKVVNDMYGYDWGDVLLKKISEMLSGFIRKEDILTRYGDEEFIIILPNTTEENAFIFAERFRREIEKMEFIPAGEEERHPITISGGISSFPFLENVDENANTLIRYAEHALYNAKKRGKNKIVLFSQVNLDY